VAAAANYFLGVVKFLLIAEGPTDLPLSELRIFSFVKNPI
jgi:hypothetical protein